MSMKSRKAFLLRIDPNLHEALEAWAQQELRSLNGQIEFILKEAVNRRHHAVPEKGLSKESGARAKKE